MSLVEAEASILAMATIAGTRVVVVAVAATVMEASDLPVVVAAMEKIEADTVVDTIMIAIFAPCRLQHLLPTLLHPLPPFQISRKGQI